MRDITRALLLCALTLVVSPVFAANLWLAPAGSDANDNHCLSQSAPCQTFDYALKRMQAFDTLWLKDGQYDYAGSGLIDADCAVKGFAPNLRIRAHHYRKARLNGYVPGHNTIRIHNCANWTIEGLVAAKRSFDSDGTNSTAVNVDVKFSPGIKLLHNVFRGEPGGMAECALNRPMTVTIRDDSDNAFLYRNEGYHCSRDCFNMKYNKGGVARQNYVHVRNPASCSETSGRTIFVNYPGGQWTWENNIGEGASEGNGVSIGCASYDRDGGPWLNCQHNRYLGHIALNSRIGLTLRRATDQPPETCPLNNTIENLLVVGSPSFTGTGLLIKDSENTVARKVSVFGVNGQGIATSTPASEAGDIRSTFTGQSLLVVGNASTGFLIDPETDEWSVSGLHAYGNTPNYKALDSGECTNCTDMVQTDPKMGACRVYAGRGHGANVIYQYLDGVESTQKLWTPIAPAGYSGPDYDFYFAGCGPVTPEAGNDDPAISCAGVASRLNVTPSCLPSGY